VLFRVGTRTRRSLESILSLYYMASAPPPGELPLNNEKNADITGSSSGDGTAAMDVTPDAPPEETWDDIPQDIMDLNTEEIMTRTRLIDNDIKEWFFLSLLSR
jgi:hypothetical protein